MEGKIEKMATDIGLDEELQEKIKKLEILEEARVRKEKRNNIIILLLRMESPEERATRIRGSRNVKEGTQSRS